MPPPESRGAPLSRGPESRGTRPTFPPESRRSRPSFPLESRAMRPAFLVLQMAMAFGMSRSVYAAAELGIADLLGDGPKTLEELAAATGTHPPALRRLMRYLCSLGLFEKDTSKRYALTYLGSALQTGAPGAVGAFLRATQCAPAWASWGEIMHSLRTGETGILRATGASLFEFLAANPTVAAAFNDSMAGLYGPEAAAITMAYDFSDAHTLVDLGAGVGRLLTTILRRHRDLRGILLDLPHVIPAAKERIAAEGVADRCEVVTGDFFAEVPAGGDVYILSHVIHDWTDEKCLTILANCRRAMKPGARLLVIESVILDDNTPDPGKLIDISMLVFTGGAERSLEEFKALFDQAGFQIDRVVATRSASSLLELRPR